MTHCSTTCSNATEVAQWATPSCSRPQPATDNGDSPKRHLHSANRYRYGHSLDSNPQPSAPEATALPMRPITQ